jgi:type IV pilus assembly protein PilW
MMMNNPLNPLIKSNSPIFSNQAGLTLVELMVSITLALLVVMSATALLLSTKSAYSTMDDAARIQDTGRYAVEVIGRAVHQTSYENWDKDDAPIISGNTISADIIGMDARSLQSATPNIQSPTLRSINGSDVLAVRFFGSGSGANGDGTVLNCAGFGVAGIQISELAEEGRGWSIFYVANDSSGEPELRCKYQGKNSWTSDAIARGVESFQVLYGLDTDADGLPNQYVTADTVNQLDQALILVGANPQAKEIDKNKKTNWKKVVAIKVAILVRGSEKSRADQLITQYDLFGSDYSNENPSDLGTAINEANIPLKMRNRSRKVFQQTIMLKNHTVVSST